MAVDDDGAPVVEIDKGVERRDVLGGFVRGSEVVEEEARLEEGVFEGLFLCVSR